MGGERLVKATARLPSGSAARAGPTRLPNGPAAWAVVSTLACGGFLATFDLNAVAFSLPTLVVEFGVSSATIAWLIIVPLAFTSLLIGIVQSLGTAWGLLQHYWVIAKLVLTLFVTVVLLLQIKTIATLARIPDLVRL